MAGLRKLNNLFYARLRYMKSGRQVEKLIPLKTKSKAKAKRLLPRIEEREKLFKQGFIIINDVFVADIPKIEDLTYEFIDYLKAKGDSERTVDLYRLALGTFQDIFNSKDISLINKSDYTYFLEKMNKHYPNKNTLNIRLRSCRAFLNWCVEFDKLNSLPFKIKSILTDHKKPKYFSNKEIEDILNQVKKDRNDELFARVKLHLNTGMRLREIETSFISNGFIHIYKSKGKSERSIPVDNETAYYYEFIKNHGKHTPGTISKMFLNAIRRLGYDRTQGGDKRCFHCLRHTFAVKTYYLTRDIYRVKTLLGHYSVTTTEIYASFDIEQLENDFGSGKIGIQGDSRPNKPTYDKSNLPIRDYAFLPN